MTRVYLSLGSNIERERYIVSALDALHECFGELVVSSVYESDAVGFEGDPFFNLVVAIDTELSVAALTASLKTIEDNNGRTRLGPKFSGRTLDIDILTYGDASGVVDGVLLPRDEVTKNAFVLWPLAEIAEREIHSGLKLSFGELWAAYDKQSQQLWPVDFEWQGRKISRAEH